MIQKGVDYKSKRLNPHKLLKKDLVWLHTHKCVDHDRFYAEHPSCYFKDLDRGLIKPQWEEKIGFFDIEACKEHANWGYVMAYSIKPKGEEAWLRLMKPKDMKKGIWDKPLMIQLCKDLRKFDRIVVYWGKNSRWDVPYVRTRTLYWKSIALREGNEEEAGLLNFPEHLELYVYDLYDPVKTRLKMSRKGLGYVSRYFGIPAKETWLDSNVMNNAMLGSKEALDRIGKHCVEDVETTEDLYNLLHVFTNNPKSSI